MCWRIKTRTSGLESWAARNLVRFQIVIANLDPEVLQWPGGSLIASLLWLSVMARQGFIAVNIIDSRRHAIGNALRERAYGARRIHSQGPGDNGSIGDV
jgi:hypothetical protein